MACQPECMPCCEHWAPESGKPQALNCAVLTCAYLQSCFLIEGAGMEGVKYGSIGRAVMIHSTNNAV